MTHFFVTPLNKTPFTMKLDSRLGRGATANVYKVNIAGNNYAVKIYNKPETVDWQKISAMTDLSQRVGYEFVKTHAWPLGLIQSEGKNIGFAMPLYDLGLFSTIDNYYDNILRKNVKDTRLLAVTNLILIAKNLCVEIDKLHAKNIHLIDIKPQNIVINTTTNEVVLLDCDGFSIEKDNIRFPGSLISADYIAPEVTINKLLPKDLGQDQDLYAISVLIFQLLNRGLHPYSGKLAIETEATTNDDKAALGNYAYGLLKNEKITPHVSSLHTMWPEQIVSLLEDCFTFRRRAPASEWIDTFDAIERNKGYVRCDKAPEDHLHIKFRDKECMECKVSKLQAAHKPPKPSTPEVTRIPPYIPPSPPPKANESSFWTFVGIIGFVIFVIFSANYDSGTSDRSQSTQNTPVVKCSNSTPNFCSSNDVCTRATYYSDGKLSWTTAAVSSGYVKEAKKRKLSCNVNSTAAQNSCGILNLGACTSARVCNAATYTSANGKKWLSSSSSWVKEAKRRNLSCGVNEQSKAICSHQTPKTCTNQSVCSYATIGNPKQWKTTSLVGRNWVAEAKRRNLNCGVKTTRNVNSCSSTTPKFCPTQTVCSNATVGNPKRWKTTDVISRRWVAEAERRKISCGVKSPDTPKMYKYTNYSIIGNDLLADGIRDISERQCVRRCQTYHNKRCKAVSYITKQRSCWLKPSPNGLQKLNGVNTITIEH